MTDPSTPDSLFRPLVERAIELAAEWHDGTYRKGRWRDPVFDRPTDQSVEVPVMAHLAAVAMIVERAGWPETVVAAAYLHDALEDQNRHGQKLQRHQLRTAVGPEVECLVAAVSEQKWDAEGKHRPWRIRKEEYVSELETAPPAAVGISLADKLHNLWSINQSLEAGEVVFGPAPERRGFNAGPSEQAWFHRAVLEASTHHDDPRLAPMRQRLREEVDRFDAGRERPKEQ